MLVSGEQFTIVAILTPTTSRQRMTYGDHLEPKSLPIGTAPEKQRRQFRQELLLMRIWSLLNDTRNCARHDFAQETDLAELHVNLIGLIGNYGGATSTELVALIGRDKGQVSHALAELRNDGLIECASRRGPHRLTEEGGHLFERLMEAAANGDAALTRGVSRGKLSGFLAVVQHIIDQAAAILNDERVCDQYPSDNQSRAETAQTSTFPARLRAGDIDRPFSLMVAPRLMTLFSYFERGAALTYKRKLNVSLFETIIVSHVGSVTTMPLADLVEITNRNKGQVGRTVRSLEQAGWLEYSPSSTARRAILELTSKGVGLFGELMLIARERDEFLLDGVSPEDRALFGEVLNDLARNAADRAERAKPNGAVTRYSSHPRGPRRSEEVRATVS